MGQITKASPATVAVVVTALMEGASLREAARRADVDLATVLRWRAAGKLVAGLAPMVPAAGPVQTAFDPGLSGVVLGRPRTTPDGTPWVLIDQWRQPRAW